MSLLQEDAVHADDAISHGEDVAKGSSHIVWASAVAFVVLSLAVAIFVWINHKPAVAAGEVTQIWAHPMHTLNSPVDAAGVQMKTEVYDQVLVFAQVRFRNESDKPIVLKEMTTNVTFDDGVHTSYAVTPTDYARIFVAYPELAGLRSKTLTRDAVIGPGAVLEGMLVSSFHVTKEQWAARKDMNFVLNFQFHPSLTLVPKAEVIEK